MKLLSICIPTYNRYIFVSQLIDKLLSFDNALYEHVNIVVSDNHSIDKTEEYFKKLTEKNIPYLHYSRNNVNIGATKNLERLIELAESKYVWWLGDDDSIEEYNVKKILDVIRSVEPSLLLLDRKVVFLNNRYVNSLFNYFFKKSITTTVEKIIDFMGPLTALGCISNIVFNKQHLSQPYDFDTFCQFKTSHPHIGFILQNLSNRTCYIDLENKITTYAVRQTPAEYEHNKGNSRISHSIIHFLAVGLPKMYNLLIEGGFIKQENIRRGSEFFWGIRRKILTKRYSDILLAITIYQRFIQGKEAYEAIRNIESIYASKAMISRFTAMLPESFLSKKRKKNRILYLAKRSIVFFVMCLFLLEEKIFSLRVFSNGNVTRANFNSGAEYNQ